MTDWYIRTASPETDSRLASWGDQVASGADGSSTNPYGSIQDLQDNETLANGDTIYLSAVGRPNYGPVTITGVRITITRWESESILPRMVNGFPISLNINQSTGGTYDVYRTPSGAVTTAPINVSQNWNVDTTATGHRYGIMEEQASVAACASNYGWHHDTGTNTLYVSIPSGADIDDYEHIVGQAGHTLLLDDCPNSIVEYISAEHALDETGTNGYGVRFDGTSSSATIRHCLSDGCRWHSLGSVADDPAGTAITNNVCRTAIAGNDSHIVIYAGASGGQISGCSISNNTIYLDPWLGPDGNPVGSVDGVIGIVSHTDAAATATPAGGLVISGNTTIWSGHNPTAYSPDCMFVAANAQFGGEPTDVTDPDTYPIRLIGNTWGGHGMQVGGGAGNTTWVASVRDRWYLDAEDMSAATGSGGLIGCTQGTSADNGLLLQSCSVSGDTVKTSSTKALLAPWSNGTLHLENTSVYMRGTGHNGGARLVAFNATADDFSANGCLFAAEQTSMRLSTGNWAGALPDAAAENAAWNNNWYDDKLSNQFNNTTSTVRSDFETTIDPDGEYDTDAGFVSTTTLEPDTATRAFKNSKSTGPTGINNRKYDATYGAYQYGTTNRSRERTGERAR